MVCEGGAKSGKAYCKSCYGVLYKHIKQVIDSVHRHGSRFDTEGTKDEMIARLRAAMMATKQRVRHPCAGGPRVAVCGLGPFSNLCYSNTRLPAAVADGAGSCSPSRYHHCVSARDKCPRCRVLACFHFFPGTAGPSRSKPRTVKGARAGAARACPDMLSGFGRGADLTMQLLRMHLTRAVALAETTVSTYLDEEVGSLRTLHSKDGPHRVTSLCLPGREDRRRAKTPMPSFCLTTQTPGSNRTNRQEVPQLKTSRLVRPLTFCVTRLRSSCHPRKMRSLRPPVAGSAPVRVTLPTQLRWCVFRSARLPWQPIG
jgi:hypothetical protein